MTQDDSPLRADFENEEIIPPIEGSVQPDKPTSAGVKRRSGRKASGRGSNRGSKGAGKKPPSILPDEFPVQPLGMSGGKYYFLSARGELVELTAGAMSHRANLVSLLAGSNDPMRHLRDLGPPTGRNDTEFNSAKAADTLMQACSELPLYDPSKPIRHFGTWRGASGYPVAHLGEDIETSATEERNGRVVAGALYPAVPGRSAPGEVVASSDDLAWVRTRIERFWNWKSEGAADLVIGWIGQAVLGQYPLWRAHMWVRGRSGAGKTTLLEIISALLGGMSTGVKNSASAASIRQTTNRMAIARIFDEAENSHTGAIQEVIELFRLMSDATGARVERGTSDHAGIRFELYGAGLLGSIIPGMMAPQDRSRFVILALNDRPRSAAPEDDALRLAELQEDAIKLGPQIWRRMLSAAPDRWDRTFRVYSARVQAMGGRSRAGDTIGALLAGWDLMLFDSPLVNAETGEFDHDRMERAAIIARPLIGETVEAEEEGEAESLLRHLFGSLLHKDHGGVVSVAELILTIQEYQDIGSGEYANKLLGRIGLRVMPGPKGQRDLFVSNLKNPQLDRCLHGTRWRGSGHKDALDTHPDIKPTKAVKIFGKGQRGRIVPARFLPGYEGPSAQPDENKGASGG